METFDLALLTRILIWISVLAWALVMAGWLVNSRLPAAKQVWTLAWLAYVGHAVAAFASHYEWSHGVAVEETARQTEALTGWRSGIGIWFNYAVGIWWGADVVRWWRTGRGWIKGKGHWRTWAFQIFLAFMIFNGTVVFGVGPARWLGVTVFALLASIQLHAKLRRDPTSDPSHS